MFFHSSSYGQNIRVEYYIVWIEVHFFHKEVISSGTDCNLVFSFCCLVEKKNFDMKLTHNTKINSPEIIYSSSDSRLRTCTSQVLEKDYLYKNFVLNISPHL